VADSRSLVLIAGKGHETTQTVGDRVLAFSDHDVVHELAGRVVCG
jgi:UDP-N-acetylmuramyl tripeptide synthase